MPSATAACAFRCGTRCRRTSYGERLEVMMMQSGMEVRGMGDDEVLAHLAALWRRVRGRGGGGGGSPGS